MDESIRTVSANVAEEQPPEHPAAATIDEDHHEPANVEDEYAEDSDYSYEDDDEGYVASFLEANAHALAVTTTRTATTSTSTATGTASAPATIEEEPAASNTAWREPTREAVNMSLRAEKETKGGKRRLAQDLYRIMLSQASKEAGFSLEPSNEDSMDKWTIKLFQFDKDSNLAKDMLVMGLEAIELEMSFPEQYPFEPPFVRVTRPRFKKQTGFVMNGALCMELLTKDGWNPINDIESVIVSIRSLLVVGDGRIEAACRLSEEKYAALLANAEAKSDDKEVATKRQRVNSQGDAKDKEEASPPKLSAGAYSAGEAEAAYSHLSDYHKKKGWDSSGWWARKG